MPVVIRSHLPEAPSHSCSYPIERPLHPAMGVVSGSSVPP